MKQSVMVSVFALASVVGCSNKANEKNASVMPEGFDSIVLPMKRQAAMALLDRGWSSRVWVEIGGFIEDVPANPSSVSKTIAEGYEEGRRLDAKFNAPKIDRYTELHFENVKAWSSVELKFDAGEAGDLMGVAFRARYDRNLYDRFVAESKTRFGTKFELDDDKPADCTLFQAIAWKLCESGLRYELFVAQCGDGHKDTGVRLEVSMLTEKCELAPNASPKL